MPRTIAIVRKPSKTMGDCLLTHKQREPIDHELALRQHAAYRAALARIGCEVVEIPATDEFPDAVFVEDPVVVVDELGVIARPATDSRRAERPSMEAALTPYRELAHITAPATIEGGDVIHIGKTLYVGRGTRTNDEGVNQLRAHIGPLGYTVIPVPVTGCLHLKTGACSIGDGRVLVNSAWVDTSAFEGLELVEVTPDEPWSANGVLVGGSIVVPAGAPKTSATLRGLGLDVHEVELSEMQKAEGSATCLCVLLDED